MTDVTLPDDLTDQVASVTSQELSAFVEAAVRQVLVSRRTRNLERARIAPVGGAGVLPDVDLTRWADTMDLQPTGLGA
ncbi:MAG: hypothetical protein FWH11_11675 [Micrococcales bacterium]|nr:hypothetical protein [Micrococcales bacterium]